MSNSECPFCRGAAADAELNRTEVWQDQYWRLTVSLSAEVPGFAYLEPKRHIEHLTDLNGPEASTFGAVMAKTTQALKEATDADVVYVYIFGDGVPHLHVHLAPHTVGDALSDQMIKGEITTEKLPNGMTRFFSRDFPPLPRSQLAEVADSVRACLTPA